MKSISAGCSADFASSPHFHLLLPDFDTFCSGFYNVNIKFPARLVLKWAGHCD